MVRLLSKWKLVQKLDDKVYYLDYYAEEEKYPDFLPDYTGYD